MSMEAHSLAQGGSTLRCLLSTWLAKKTPANVGTAAKTLGSAATGGVLKNSGFSITLSANMLTNNYINKQARYA